jgi:hypothetical protein
VGPNNFMKRTTYLFFGAIIAAAVIVCMGAKITGPASGSGTLATSQFNTNTFGVAGGVVYPKNGGIWTNFIATQTDTTAPGLIIAGTADALAVSMEFTNQNGAVNSRRSMVSANAGLQFGFLADGSTTLNVGLSISRSGASPSGVLISVPLTVASDVSIGYESGGSLASGFGCLATGGASSVALGYAAESRAGNNFLFVGNLNSGNPITNAVTESFKVYATGGTYTYAPFQIVTNAPALAAWRTNNNSGLDNGLGQQMTVEADFLLTPDATHAAGVTLTVELAGSFTNVWKRTAPAAIGAETVGMTHRIQPGARYQFTDSSASPASAAFVARAYAEIYE